LPTFEEVSAVHLQDIQPSPEPEFIECPRCGQPVLKDNLSRQWNEWGQVCWCESCGSLEAGCHAFDEPVPAPISDLQRATTHRTLDTVEQIAVDLTEVPATMSELERLPATTQSILHTVQQITRDLTEIPARAFTSRLESLIDELVSSLVPLMAAEERVLCNSLDTALGDALRDDHRETRRLIERLTMVSEGLERRSRRAPKREPMLLTALQEMTAALGGLSAHQHAALRHLSGTVPLDEQARLAATLDAAALDAREQTTLIVRPAIPPTAAVVLRHRPDLNAAYAISLAEYDRQSHRGAASAAEGKPT
jgi:Hemerythrin HHE cation binding domain